MKQYARITLCLIFTALSGGLNAQDDHAHIDEVAETGPHGGRLLETDNFSVELLIYETGVEPQYRAWAFAEGEELSTESWNLNVALTRLGGSEERFTFSPVTDGNYLLGSGVVTEPHSFDVMVTATYGNRPYSFDYESYEGRMEMSAEVAEQNGVKVAEATSQVLHETVRLYGNIVPDPNQISHVHARYEGIIQEINLNLGDRVERGELIAVIEANNSLQDYEIHAPISGIVVDIHANPGELAGEESLMTIANYASVWAELNLFPGQIHQIHAGQPVLVRSGQFEISSTLRYLNPGEGRTPYVVARAPIDNTDRVWTPGLLVEGEITVGDYTVDLAVNNRALQQFRDWDVVFIRIGQTYEIRPLELGRSDGYYTEVISGLSAGDTYVVENSFLLKADIEKSGATHNH